MRVIIRTDASIAIGSGHVIRCLTLADQLRTQGAEVVFLCAALPGALIELVRSRGYVCAELSHCVANSVEVDADATLTAAAEMMQVKVDWLIVDHYGLDADWEDRVRDCCCRLMVIDDIANRPHSCDLLLDQNYADEGRYHGLVSVRCRLLLGPAYALLRPEYASNRGAEELRKRPIESIFVFFGGSDPSDLTGKTLKALMIPELIRLKVDVVVGSNYRYHEALNLLAKQRGQTTVHGVQLHLADLMKSADLAVGAGGVTNWERMTLGLPSIVITVADNQVPISVQLHEHGVIRHIGTSDYISIEQISNALLDEIRFQTYLERIAPSMAMCDGRGAGRVLNVMQQIQQSEQR